MERVCVHAGVFSVQVCNLTFNGSGAGVTQKSESAIGHSSHGPGCISTAHARDDIEKAYGTRVQLDRWCRRAEKAARTHLAHIRELATVASCTSGYIGINWANLRLAPVVAGPSTRRESNLLSAEDTVRVKSYGVRPHEDGCTVVRAIAVLHLTKTPSHRTASRLASCEVPERCHNERQTPGAAANDQVQHTYSLPLEKA